MPTLQRRVEGWSGCLGSRALLSSHAGCFRRGQVAGAHIFGWFFFPPRWNLPPSYLDAYSLASLWTGTSRKGSRRSWLASGHWGCTVVAAEGSLRCVPQITGGMRETASSPLGQGLIPKRPAKPGSLTDRASTLLQNARGLLSKGSWLWRALSCPQSLRSDSQLKPLWMDSCIDFPLP